MKEITSLNIQIQAVPDDTWFRVDEIRPFISDGILTITEGRGTSRAWGSPSCDSLVYLVDDSIIAVHVTGWHKHTVSPVGGWYYFIQEKDGWRRVTANKKEVKSIKSLLPERGTFSGDMPDNIRQTH